MMSRFYPTQYGNIPNDFIYSRIKALEYDNKNNNNICFRISRETSSMFLNVHNMNDCASIQINC